MVIATVILWCQYGMCLKNFNKKFDQINQGIKDKTTVLLSSSTDSVLLKQIIFNNGYCETERDAAFIAQTLVDRLQNGEMESFNSLYALQKRVNGQVSARVADSCQVLSTALRISREKLGSADDIFPYVCPLDAGSDSISVVVERELERAWYQRALKEPCANVPVRLQMHYRDSHGDPQVQTFGYVYTNEDGIAIFHGLCADSSYSVLPIREGFEYGQSKGVVGGEWIVQRGLVGRLCHEFSNWIRREKDNEFRFVEKEHRIPMLNNTALRQIKNERTIIVRSPDEFKNEVVKSRRGVIWSWWALAVCLAFFFRRKKKLPQRYFDLSSGLIVACCMLLSGLSVLMMFSMVDPVNDEIKGLDMTIGVMIGVGVSIALQFVDFIKRYNQETPLFRIRRRYLHEFLMRHHLRGIGWLIMALLLTGLLFTPLGKDVGGMIVNIAIGSLVFQPSEIAKYLIILFSAIFFVENNDRIIHYSDEFNTSWWQKMKVMWWMIIGLTLLMIIYLILGDMGPGLVLGITFTLLYSFCKSKQELPDSDKIRKKKWLKCDLMVLVYGVFSYAIILIVLNKLKIGYWYFVGSGVWLAGWIFFGVLAIRKSLKFRRWIWKKQIHETAIIMNLVIFVFILGNNAGNDFGVLKRLEDRTSMCTNTWGGMDEVVEEAKHDTITYRTLSNPVSNTQVVNGLWALSSGGCKGQGWGCGKPSVIPAFHTDMILSSIGEQRGFKGLFFVIILFSLLLITVARKGIKTGEPFAMFFCMGVAIVTAVQFFVIALGSTGVIPLTGVTVPLLSYGRVSMILNIAAFGFVLSLVTREDPITNETHLSVKDDNEKSCKWTSYVAAGMLVFATVFTVGVWAKYQIFQRKKTLLQPVFVINIHGDPVLEYNPRITLVTNEMYVGRIFDRNGVNLKMM